MGGWRCAATVMAIGSATLMVRPATAQDNYEIQVYGSALVPTGATMVELHSNYTTRSAVDLGADQYTTRHAEHETLEITHGFTDFFEIGYYNFTTIQPGVGFDWVGTHLRPRVSIPASWHWPVGLSLSQEFGYQRKEYSPDTWTWELRPIIDQQIGRFYWALNPTLEIVLKGPDAGNRPEFSPNVQIGVDVSRRVNLALEYYGNFGPLFDFEAFTTTEQELFPAINYNFGPDWEFNLATGIALTHHTDVVGLKMIIGHRFGLAHGE
jgi:hypothetical protein